MSIPKFTKTVIGAVENDIGGYPMNTFVAAGDINRDGKVEIVVAGREGRMVWLENRGRQVWVPHVVDAHMHEAECGGSLFDVTGNGLLDIIVGQGGGDEISWWENPGEPDVPWKKRLILKSGANQFHDTLIGDALNTGHPCLLMTNQHGPGGTTVYCVPIPQDPTVSPWPGAAIIARGKAEPLEAPDGQIIKQQPEEGLAIGDVDGDGLNEVVAGTHWYKCVRGQWEGHRFASGYITTKIAIGDLDGDGRNEIVLAEGDPVIYGKAQGGRAGWFKAGPEVTAPWTEHILDDGLLDAHTLLLADLCGSGRLDVLVGEIGIASATRGYRRRAPWILLCENLGGGRFARHIIDEGTGIHDGILADLASDGRPGLVCKPLHGPNRWSIVAFSRDPA